MSEQSVRLTGLQLDPESMRRLGYAAIDALVERQQQLAGSPPWDGQEISVADLLPPVCPEQGRPADQVLQAALGDVLPHAARLDHPRFFGFIPSSPTWPAVLADLLAAGFDIFSGTRLGSVGASQVEDTVIDWFRQWVGMPEGAAGLFTSGGSAANLYAVVAARDAWPDPGAGVVYMGAAAHSSMGRACRVAGIRRARVRVLPSDPDGRMSVDALSAQLEQDRRAGLLPLLVAATAGTTGTGVIDDLQAIGDLARDHDAWFHVDAAYGGFARLTSRGQTWLAGIESADSVTMDPHKWLFQPFEAGCLLVRDPRALRRAFHVAPDYLRDVREFSGSADYADRGMQLSRSFRALKVWMSLSTFGRAAHAAAIDAALDLAVDAADHVLATPPLALMTGPNLGIVTFQVRPDGWEDMDDDARDRLQEQLCVQARDQGVAFLSTTRVRGRRVLRMCILGFHTGQDDVRATLDWFAEAGRHWRP